MKKLLLIIPILLLCNCVDMFMRFTEPSGHVIGDWVWYNGQRCEVTRTYEDGTVDLAYNYNTSYSGVHKSDLGKRSKHPAYKLGADGVKYNIDAPESITGEIVKVVSDGKVPSDSNWKDFFKVLSFYLFLSPIGWGLLFLLAISLIIFAVKQPTKLAKKDWKKVPHKRSTLLDELQKKP